MPQFKVGDRVEVTEIPNCIGEITEVYDISVDFPPSYQVIPDEGLEGVCGFTSAAIDERVLRLVGSVSKVVLWPILVIVGALLFWRRK